MAPSTHELLEFKKLVNNNLTYAVISKMEFETYKNFVYKFFDELDHLRRNGLTFHDIDEFMRWHYSKVINDADDNDIMFERRFSGITEELAQFCSDPFFWLTDYNTYMKKWERNFEIDWFRKV